MNKFLLPILLSEILCSCTCTKLPMAADGIVRLSKIEVYPEYLEEYLEYAIRVGEISLRTEPGVLTMYAVSEKENPCMVTNFRNLCQSGSIPSSYFISSFSGI